MKIACPKCGFSPTPNILWRCQPGCGRAWHTFATHGVCPTCGKMWHDTQCPRCRLWSLHDDWYHETEPVREKEVEETSQT